MFELANLFVYFLFLNYWLEFQCCCFIHFQKNKERNLHLLSLKKKFALIYTSNIQKFLLTVQFCWVTLLRNEYSRSIFGLSSGLEFYSKFLPIILSSYFSLNRWYFLSSEENYRWMKMQSYFPQYFWTRKSWQEIFSCFHINFYGC